jgi:hypothetical protein
MGQVGGNATTTTTFIMDSSPLAKVSEENKGAINGRA